MMIKKIGKKMNSAIENILTRRSIRKYDKSKKVSKEQIDTILKSAMSAPTARNQQGWYFVVVSNPKQLLEISKNIPHAKMVKTADFTIIVCYEVTDEMQKLYWVQDASASTQNILLSANALGIGSVWCAVHPREAKINFIKKEFNLPLNIEPLSLVALGYPAEKKGYEERFDEAEIQYNV